MRDEKNEITKDTFAIVYNGIGSIKKTTEENYAVFVVGRSGAGGGEANFWVWWGTARNRKVCDSV